MLSRLVCVEQSSVSSSESSATPTTSIGSSSSLSSLSDEFVMFWPRCWETYSAFSASKSTVMPFARSFLACLSIAFAIFFLLRALPQTKKKFRMITGCCLQGDSLFSRANLLWWYRFAGARLRVSVVCRSSGSFFRVFALSHLGSSVLEPDLKKSCEVLLNVSMSGFYFKQ